MDEEIKNKSTDFGPLFWLHIVLIIGILTTPFFVDWRLILVGIALLQLQYWFFKGCVLSNKELGQGNGGFWFYYLKKVLPKITVRSVDIFTELVLPGIVLGIAFVRNLL